MNRPLKILITNTNLSERAGTQLYVRDVAIALQRRGHSPFVYSPALGEAARDLRDAVIPVVDDLGAIAAAPDVIHGQHHLETMAALLHFNQAPAVFFCHGWIPWEEAPPRFSRIVRYAAVDYAVRDRLVFEGGIPEAEVRVILNFVDLERFKPRAPLPPKPRRALLFSNYASKTTYAGAVRKACARTGIRLDIIGSGVNNTCRRPEEVLGHYDLVFGKAKAAMEAMAVGAAVVLCDMGKIGPMVTAKEFDRLRALNFGIRTLGEPVSEESLLREIGRYDAADAAGVSSLIRRSADRETVVDGIVALYEEAIGEKARRGPADPAAEEKEVAAYLRWLSRRIREFDARSLEQARLITLYHGLRRIPLLGDWIKTRLSP